MYCRKCGTKLKDGLRFCTECGVELNAVEEVAPKVIKEKIIKVDNVEEKPLAKEGLIIGLIVCVLVVSITSIFVISYYSRDVEPKYYVNEV